MFDTLKKTKKKLLNSTSGSFGMIAAFLIPVLLISVGSAVDLTRAHQTKTRMSLAIDSATLTAAKMMANNAKASDAEAKAEAYFLANIASQGLRKEDFKTFSFKVNPATNRVNASVVAKYKTQIMSIAGYKTVDIGVRSETEYGQRTVEVAFVLDTTGSMRGNRMRSLKTAMENAVNTLIPPGTSSNNTKVRISLVPYADTVNLGSIYQERATNRRSNSHNCVAEREWPGVGANYKYADIAPLLDDPSTRDEENRLFDLDPKIAQILPSSCPATALRPLTNNRTDLLKDIKNLKTRGYTAGHNGIQWGLNTISGNYDSFWATEHAPLDYGTKDLDKYLIVMTDGAFNTAYYDKPRKSGAWNYRGGTASDSNKAALALCDIAKEPDKGITVYSIAFNAGRSAENTLKKCATSKDKHFFAPKTGTALNSVFNQIAQEIKRILLTS